MAREHTEWIQMRFEGIDLPRIDVLDIPDDFDFMSDGHRSVPVNLSGLRLVLPDFNDGLFKLCNGSGQKSPNLFAVGPSGQHDLRAAYRYGTRERLDPVSVMIFRKEKVAEQRVIESRKHASSPNFVVDPLKLEPTTGFEPVTC